MCLIQHYNMFLLNMIKNFLKIYKIFFIKNILKKKIHLHKNIYKKKNK